MKFKNGKQFLLSVNKYVEHCKAEERIPNRAGYLRFFKIPSSEYKQICETCQKEVEIAEAIFEDEALNVNPKRVSAGILSLYLKSRFGYGAPDTEEPGEFKIIYDGDSCVDGE